ncbi:glycerophosphodiester phosphodiesterase [Lactobacillus gigeriorum]|uniref:Glycerophosphodiester phosphodiesterase family protein n=2 Tax=Lactobacillus TaxID=1578 RepID=A0ABR5PX81_9LACO|nr:glycerophosphodiester phosphodiesterase [Lactobacillus gigeriorum]KRN14320.1 glycerophosphodiester phosphodiesterase family protein [Lactobacillus gigeriorum DSM 23908 = CRBIP 24.85]
MKLLKHIFQLIFLMVIFILTSGFTVVGHRGDPTKYPEETIQSDNSAFKSGADYVELDLSLSKDGVPVISHDDDLFRVTHIHKIVSQNPFATLNQLQYDNGEHVLSLGQLFKYYQNKPTAKFILETKIDHSIDHSYHLEDKIALLIHQYHMEDRVIIHSFSAASLFYFHKIIPSVPLIYLVGSLKRINFSILPQVGAVNVAADVIQEHAWLIHWLHSLHKKVFVWTEMNESPSLWEWLINRNIDGVVTNFPELGFKYKLAKMGSKKYPINRTGIYFGKQKTPTMMNPYIRVHEKQYIYPGQKLKIMYGVNIDNHWYYQIAKHTFISAEFVTLDLTENDVQVYHNQKIIAKPQRDISIYKYPNNLAKTNKKLQSNKLYTILNFNGSPKSLWIYTNQGWIKARQILFYGFFNDSLLHKYQQQKRLNRYNNIALLKFRLDEASTSDIFEQNLATEKIIRQLKSVF